MEIIRALWITSMSRWDGTVWSRGGSKVKNLPSKFVVLDERSLIVRTAWVFSFFLFFYFLSSFFSTPRRRGDASLKRIEQPFYNFARRRNGRRARMQIADGYASKARLRTGSSARWFRVSWTRMSLSINTAIERSESQQEHRASLIISATRSPSAVDAKEESVDKFPVMNQANNHVSARLSKGSRHQLNPSESNPRRVCTQSCIKSISRIRVSRNVRNAVGKRNALKRIPKERFLRRATVHSVVTIDQPAIETLEIGPAIRVLAQRCHTRHISATLALLLHEQ